MINLEDAMLSKIMLIDNYKNIIKANLLQKYNYKEESLSLIYIIAKLLLGTDVEDYINTKELLSKIDCTNVEYEYTSVMEILSLIKSFLSRVYYPSVSNIRDLDDYKKVLTHIKSKRQNKVG